MLDDPAADAKASHCGNRPPSMAQLGKNTGHQDSCHRRGGGQIRTLQQT
jgi:hypothetical protein